MLSNQCNSFQNTEDSRKIASSKHLCYKESITEHWFEQCNSDAHLRF